MNRGGTRREDQDGGWAGLRYDPRDPDIADLTRQIDALAEIDRRGDRAWQELLRLPSKSPPPAEQIDPLWRDHEVLLDTFSLGLRPGQPEPFPKHVFLLNRGYMCYRGGEPPEKVAFDPAPWPGRFGRLVQRFRRWLFDLLADYFSRFEGEMRRTWLEQMTFNANVARLANDLRIKLDAQLRFNEAVTEALEKAIRRFHEHQLALDEQGRQVGDLHDVTSELVGMMEATRERLLAARQVLEDAPEAAESDESP